jgi:alpha-tubulin suppressor-like RCC1 family protein
MHRGIIWVAASVAAIIPISAMSDTDMDVYFRGTGHVVGRATGPSLGASGSTQVAYGSSLALSFKASGGKPPYSFEVQGTLPGTVVGTLAQAGDVFTLSGKAAGSYPGIGIVVTDSAGKTATSGPFLIEFAAPASPLSLVASSGYPGIIVAGASWSQSFVASGGLAPYSFPTSFGAIGLESMVFQKNGTDTLSVSGIPALGTYGPFTLSTVDGAGYSASAAPFSIRVIAPLTVQAPVASSLSVFSGAPWNVQPIVAGGTGTRSYSIAPALPTGVVLAADGKIAGTPAPVVNGAFPYTYTVKDAYYTTTGVSVSFTMNVAQPLALPTPSAGSLAITSGTAWNIAMTATGGDPATPTKTYTIAPALPAGVTLSQTTGIIGGTPTIPGALTQTYTVTVSDPSVSTPVSKAIAVVVTAGSTGYMAWGDNNYGQLGLGTYSTTPVMTPTATLAGQSFDIIKQGGSHACGLKGTVLKCWGSNNRGQTGNPTGTVTLVPYTVTGSFDSFTIGSNHTCGMTGAVIKCWGSNDNAQLGMNLDSLSHPTPVVVAMPSASVTAKSMVSGNSHNCMIGSDNEIYCWGLNSSWETGYSASSTGQKTVRYATTAVTSDVKNLSAGGYTCGILASTSKMKCFGPNYRGGYGVGTSPASSSADAALGPATAQSFTSISVSNLYACGLNGKNLYCWGNNDNAQVGTGSNSPDRYATAGAAETVIAGSWDQVVTGAVHACARSGTQVKCWGTNISGQMANGSKGSTRHSPTLIAGSYSEIYPTTQGYSMIAKN